MCTAMLEWPLQPLIAFSMLHIWLWPGESWKSDPCDAQGALPRNAGSALLTSVEPVVRSESGHRKNSSRRVHGVHRSVSSPGASCAHSSIHEPIMKVVQLSYIRYMAHFLQCNYYPSCRDGSSTGLSQTRHRISFVSSTTSHASKVQKRRYARPDPRPTYVAADSLCEKLSEGYD